MKTTINVLIDQYTIAETEVEKKSIKNQIHLQYYDTSAAERLVVVEIMKPFLDEIEQEMIEKDPIARQTHGMFKRLAASKNDFY